jgi:hypothetical protein
MPFSVPRSALLNLYSPRTGLIAKRFLRIKWSKFPCESIPPTGLRLTGSVALESWRALALPPLDFLEDQTPDENGLAKNFPGSCSEESCREPGCAW